MNLGAWLRRLFSPWHCTQQHAPPLTQKRLADDDGHASKLAEFERQEQLWQQLHRIENKLRKKEQL